MRMSLHWFKTRPVKGALKEEDANWTQGWKAFKAMLVNLIPSKRRRESLQNLTPFTTETLGRNSLIGCKGWGGKISLESKERCGRFTALPSQLRLRGWERSGGGSSSTSSLTSTTSTRLARSSPASSGSHSATNWRRISWRPCSRNTTGRMHCFPLWWWRCLWNATSQLRRGCASATGRRKAKGQRRLWEWNC